MKKIHKNDKIHGGLKVFFLIPSQFWSGVCEEEAYRSRQAKSRLEEDDYS